MSDSIKTLIIKNVVTQLEKVLIVNGYNQDIKFVSDGDLILPENLPADKFPAYFVTDQDANKSYADESSVEVLLNLLITVYAQSNSDEDPAQDKRRKLELDAEKAIMADWEQAGLAYDTLIVKILSDIGAFPNYGISDMTVQVKFYHDRGEPDSQANSPV